LVMKKAHSPGRTSAQILLDEISEMPLSLQAKLLRVLQEKEVEHLGAHQSIKLDVRVVSTTNRDLQNAVKSGNFREDLYFRLNVFSLVWPALKDRVDDIMPLALHFIHEFDKDNALSLTAAAITKLKQYNWPGNVRELHNVIERAIILKDKNTIEESHILLESMQNFDVEENAPLNAKLKYEAFSAILLTLKEMNGSKKDTAKKLGMSDRTLRYKLAQMKENGMYP